MSLMSNLMRSVVDYAGLFPPAGLSMQQVVANYAKYRESRERSMLGRLIVPAGQLSVFENAASGHFPTDGETAPWRISALVPPLEPGAGPNSTTDFDAAFTAIHAFNEKHLTEGDVGAVIDAVEVKTATSQLVEATIARIPDSIATFFEIPHQSDPDKSIQLIKNQAAGKRVFAKIRTGGITPELIPTVAELARFIASCAAQRVGFKATAGLHHPLRAEYRLTYTDDSPTSVMHGFLNVFVATAFAFAHSIPLKTISKILDDRTAKRFEFADDELKYDDLEISTEQMINIRNNNIFSFGSCSFVEPTLELQKIPGVSRDSLFPD